MTGITLLYFIILLVYGTIYAALIFSYTIGWFKLKSFIPPAEKTHKTKASIIIPARDEEDNIEKLLDDLINQSVSANNYEIIVVDDNSSDQTKQIVSTMINKNPGINLQLLEIPESARNAPYKKKAIHLAIQNSTGSLIITTDADCRVEKNWLNTILAFYEKEKPKMIVGPVSFHNETSAFENMQTLEFLSLIAITGGAIRIGKPIMCNGANLAYEKEAFYTAGGFGADKFSSGDDVFLLYKIMKMFGNNSVRFLKNYNAIVYTQAKKSVKEFIHQRTRWASKNKGYNAKILFVSSSVYLTNLLMVAGLIASIFYTEIFKLQIISLLIKTLIEIPILIGISTFVKRKRIFLYSFPLIFLYPLYIVITGALGILGIYTWKGRTVKN